MESTRSRTIRGELPSLSHLLELTHTVGSQAERTAAEAERDRKADDAAVRALIESGLLKLLQPARLCWPSRWLRSRRSSRCFIVTPMN
jgi:hypothetical protein